MNRRSISIPDKIMKDIKEIAIAKPHMTENAIIIDLLLAGISYLYGERFAPKTTRK